MQATLYFVMIWWAFFFSVWPGWNRCCRQTRYNGEDDAASTTFHTNVMALRVYWELGAVFHQIPKNKKQLYIILSETWSNVRPASLVNGYNLLKWLLQHNPLHLLWISLAPREENKTNFKDHRHYNWHSKWITFPYIHLLRLFKYDYETHSSSPANVHSHRSIAVLS